jgi:hypothetical protein
LANGGKIDDDYRVRGEIADALQTAGVKKERATID